MTGKTQLFLASNILFSSARDPQSELRALWTIPDIDPLVFQFVIDEVSRHLQRAETRASLWRLVYQSHLGPSGDEIVLPDFMSLPAKDRSVLQSALAGSAHLLATGDRERFSSLFGLRMEGLEIISTTTLKSRYPDYLRSGRA